MTNESIINSTIIKEFIIIIIISMALAGNFSDNSTTFLGSLLSI